MLALRIHDSTGFKHDVLFEFLRESDKDFAWDKVTYNAAIAKLRKNDLVKTTTNKLDDVVLLTEKGLERIASIATRKGRKQWTAF